MRILPRLHQVSITFPDNISISIMAEVNGNHSNGAANGTNGNHTNGASNGTNGFVKKPVVNISVALSPNNLPAVPDILKGISSLSTATLNGDDQSRLELVEKARQLVRALETPRETMIKHCWAQV
ncbi:hypothetical protein IMZ48_35240, partial [Candidatus Bathyarchaeota archaeon]|nr:hypothetical protein [Candidatus Bathyarchaeota archaeon]